MIGRCIIVAESLLPHITRLDDTQFLTGVEWLTGREPLFAAIVAQFGQPDFVQRKPDFSTLVHFILEQQVSLASAQATFDRLCLAARPLTPTTLLALDDATLREVGFSRQKIRYVRDLAERIATDKLDLQALASLPDEEVRALLMEVTGIGLWTANVYLLMALCRPDVWPSGDLAVLIAWQEQAQQAARPSTDELTTLALAWRPYRTVAAHLLWHAYLAKRGAR